MKTRIAQSKHHGWVIMLLLVFSVLVANISSGYGAPGDIITVAGGIVADNSQAMSAHFTSPRNIALDNSGNLYVADSPANLVYKVSSATGTISVVAGNGVAGFSGDGGAAVSARLYNPAGITLDNDGNLYIADNGNHRIRKVTVTTGIVTTVAGNGTGGFSGDGVVATSASLNRPGGIARDSSGNLYIADTYNNRIRKVTVSTGIITTVVGSGTGGFSGDGDLAVNAYLNNPEAIRVSVSGDLLVVDSDNNRIRRVSAATGIISTIAGNGTAGFSGDGGLATGAELYYPVDVALDGAENLYVADYVKNRVRKITAATGVISTLAGDGEFGFKGDGSVATSASFLYLGGVAADSTGNVYVVDRGNKRVRKVDVTSGIISTVAGNGIGEGEPAVTASLNVPYGVALDTGGNILVADFNNHRIRKISVESGSISTVAGSGIGAYFEDGAASVAMLNGPTGVAVDASGNVYIADRNNHRIRKVAVDTNVITTVAGNGTGGYAGDGGPATSATLSSPSGVAVDGAGNIYIADNNNHCVRKVTVATGIIATIAGIGTAGFSGDGGAATSAKLNSPWGVALDGSGVVYIADSGNHRIRKVTVAGIISTVAGNGAYGFGGDGSVATAASLNSPRNIAIDSAGNLFIADVWNHRVRKVDGGTGVISTVAGSQTVGYAGDGGPAISASLFYPMSVAVNSGGDIIIADAVNNRVRKALYISVAAPTVTTEATSLVTADTAVLNGKVLSNGAFTSAHFEYGTSIAYGTSVMAAQNILSGSPEGISVSKAVESLACNTTYHTRLVGQNSAGISYGDDQTFTTSVCPIHGECGSANNGVFSVAPVSGLCTSGTPSGVTGTGPWSWSCSGSNGGSTAVCSASVQGYVLSVGLTGYASGIVASITPNLPFSCVSGVCTTNYTTGTEITLRAGIISGSNTVFTGWSGACSGTGDCALFMSSDQNVKAQFMLTPGVRVNGLGDYGTLTSAYGVVPEGGVIQAKASLFTGDLTLTRGLNLVLRGGYADNYGSQVGYSELDGALTVVSGSIVLDAVIIK